jgi:hypothetical protein
MSRTKKDRPYWVKTNDSQYTDHDHIHLGEVYYTDRYVRDEHGKKISETVYTYQDAYSLVHGGIKGLWASSMTYGERNRIDRLARKALSRKCPEEQILVRETTRWKTVRVVKYTTPDHCTEGVKMTGDMEWRQLPCTPDVIPEMYGPIYGGYHSSRVRQSYREVDNGHNRSQKRDTLRSTVKGYNSGEDVENYENDYRINKWWW